MFIPVVTVHIIDSGGLILSKPLTVIMFRVFIFLYIIFVDRNIHDDVNP